MLQELEDAFPRVMSFGAFGEPVVYDNQLARAFLEISASALVFSPENPANITLPGAVR